MVIAKIDHWEIAKSDMKAFVALSSLYFQLHLSFTENTCSYKRPSLDYIVCLNNKYMTETVMFGIKYVEP